MPKTILVISEKNVPLHSKPSGKTTVNGVPVVSHAYGATTHEIWYKGTHRF